MEKNFNEYDGDYDAVLAFENRMYHNYIEILAIWKENLWKSYFNGTTVELIPYIHAFDDLDEELNGLRKYLPEDLYMNFMNEYYMTMYLLRSSLKNAADNGYLIHTQERKDEVMGIIAKTDAKLKNCDNLDLLVDVLRSEDVATREELRSMGIPEEKINEIIASGHKTLPELEPFENERTKN